MTNRTPEVVLLELKKIFEEKGISCLSSISSEWFEAANANFEKGLDQQVFKEALNHQGLNLSDSETEELFKKFDADKSGKVTYGEFVAGLRGPMPEFSATLAFMHQSTGHFPTNQAQIRAARPQFDMNETQDWLESLDAVVDRVGKTRARFLLHELMDEASRLGVNINSPVVSPMLNTIPTSAEPAYPGDRAMEERISNIIRWNAAVMVSDANKRGGGVGGHIGTFASICDAYEVGQNHFWRGKGYGGGRGDSIWVQGHASPGPYARAFLEGRLSIDQVMNFRRESNGNGLSSYPHPRLMPDFWENPTVSMGLGPLGAVYQARFFRYLHLRGLADTSKSRVWAFVGDGESDEPETVTAISVAGRERLNNLIIIVNCNYQRLDGPVRGNSKVMQEFEGVYRGAGFDVVKVLWGSKFNTLIDADHDGKLIEALENTPDGDCQRLHAKADGALIRKDLFEKHGLLDRVAHWSDEELLEAFQTPGGHDHSKIYAAFAQAERNAEMGGRPTVILLKTLKGYSLQTFLGRNTVHQKKTMSEDDMLEYRTRMGIPLTDEQVKVPNADNFLQLKQDSAEFRYMKTHRDILGGPLPKRDPCKVSSLVQIPDHSVYSVFDAGSKGREISTTMVFAQFLRKMMQAGEFGKRISLMVTDESRTFGLDTFFPVFKIHAPFGQNYTPVDADQLLKYAEAPNGQILQEGISEGGAIMTWIASATSYASQQCPTLPFMIYYSMFGFQRVGDSIWQAADMRARGFLIGATYGRTTLNGEGLQHQDGHSLLIALTCPAVRGWDPAFGYEMGTIIEHGVKEMWGEDKDVIYYITAYNENYPMPEKPEGADEGIIKGLYKFQDAKTEMKHTVRIVGSGAIMKQALDAIDLLAEFGVGAEIWSATSYGELQREANACDRKARLGQEVQKSWAEQCLGDGEVTVAVSDNMTAWPMIIDPWVGGEYIVLGADGFGRSDTREALRRFHEIDKEHVAVAALRGLAKIGKVPASIVDEAISKFGIDTGPREDITMDLHVVTPSVLFPA
jgi:pyruvate dehydrogenase E1 component